MWQFPSRFAYRYEMPFIPLGLISERYPTLGVRLAADTLAHAITVGAEALTDPHAAWALKWISTARLSAHPGEKVPTQLLVAEGSNRPIAVALTLRDTTRLLSLPPREPAALLLLQIGQALVTQPDVLN